MYDTSLKVVNVKEQMYFLTGIICPVSAVESNWPNVSNSLWFDHLTQSNPMYGKYMELEWPVFYNDIPSLSLSMTV